MLAVRIALRNHLFCSESPATLSNTLSHFLPFSAPAQLQILPPRLTHQFISVAFFHSSRYLILNSATFSGDLYSSVIMVQIKMSRLLANVPRSKAPHSRGARSMANIPHIM